MEGADGISRRVSHPAPTRVKYSVKKSRDASPTAASRLRPNMAAVRLTFMWLIAVTKRRALDRKPATTTAGQHRSHSALDEGGS